GYAAPLFVESIVKQPPGDLPEAALCACPGYPNAGGSEPDCIPRIADGCKPVARLSAARAGEN
ncbi:hypothetical protein, partial [Escherichia coli]|uniref:hypothetical protein n=1 Tax=Escherichia coli TaxID=562 RepID=UPI0029DD78FD